MAPPRGTPADGGAGRSDMTVGKLTCPNYVGLVQFYVSTYILKEASGRSLGPVTGAVRRPV
ncbi:hypothetical protein GCM10010191_37310 [Actinomadura vinacea]|uniref:Uncharacterized protein n=1 Tax=Actinomadura vinacea TaxID=115336 RepID=A0ABN3J639_9ACTN